MQIKDIIKLIRIHKIKGISCNSKLVRKNFLFVAVKGAKVERHENVSVVEENGVRWAYVAGIEPDDPKNLTYEAKSLECFDKLKAALISAGFGLEDIARVWAASPQRRSTAPSSRSSPSGVLVPWALTYCT